MIRFILAAAFLFLTIKLSHCDKMLKILHTNRLHANFESRGKGNKARGGISRIIHYVNVKKSGYAPVLYFDTMDWFPGSIWYSVHKERISIEFMKLLNVDALGLGDSEMYVGDLQKREENFWKYINAICEKPIVCANCYITSEFQGSNCVEKSKIIDVKGLQVGVTSFIQRDLAPSLFFKNVKFTNELEAINEEVKMFTTMGINIIIVIAHGYYNFIVETIKKLVNVDLVIAGHTRKLLHNGVAPHGLSEGPYPTEIQDAKGEDVLFVCAGDLGEYIGSLDLMFNKSGKITAFKGNTQHMGSSIKEDKKALDLLKTFRPLVEMYRNQIVGKSRVYLNASCQKDECNFGNLLADAYIHHRANQWAESKAKHWTDTPIAFFNSGNIKTPIVAENKTIVMADLMQALPYNNGLMILTINGSELRRIFEYSADLVTDPDGSPRFLQVSGIHITYDLAKGSMEKIISMKARCSECETPIYEDVEDRKIYRIITTEFIGDGGDGYIFYNAQPQHIQGSLETDVLRRYIKFCRIVQIGSDERIIITNGAPMRSSSEYMKENKSSSLLFFMWVLHLCNVFYVYLE